MSTQATPLSAAVTGMTSRPPTKRTKRPNIKRRERADRESRVRQLCAMNGGQEFTISDVARGTGLHLTHVSRIFNGHRQPSLEAASKIANYLGVSLDQLFKVLQP